MIRRLILAAAAPVVAVAAAGPVVDRLASRLMRAPRHLPGEASMTAALDALGGEVVRLRARDGIALTGRWLPAEPAPADAWVVDPREAILLLHGWSGSVAPDVLELSPFLRRTANVLGLDFRGHGGSDDAPTTFGVGEVEDVAGALAWLGQRGIARVALLGSSMGGVTAIASVAVLGDGRLAAADLDPDAPSSPAPAPRPRIACVVAESVPPELAIGVASRLPFPFGRLLADRAFARMGRRVGADPRRTQPMAVISLLEDVPLLLVHGSADRVVPPADVRRLAAAGGPGTRLVMVEGAGHGDAHATDPGRYDREVTEFLRAGFARARS